MNSDNRHDRIETFLEQFVLASDARFAALEQSANASDVSMDRLKGLLESSITASNARMDRLEALVEISYEPVQALLEAATQNQAMIARLDTIIERMVYREGREE